MQNKHLLTLFVLILFNSTAIADGLPPLTHSLTPLKPSNAPELKFNNLDDELIDVATYKGQVVIVNFWATWCPPCRREMGSLERLHQSSKDNNVKIIAVNIGEDEETVFSFMGTIDPSPNFEVVLDADGVSMDRWKVKGLPTTYMLNKKGKIVYQAIGGREFDHPEIINTVNLLKNRVN